MRKLFKAAILAKVFEELKDSFGSGSRGNQQIIASYERRIEEIEKDVRTIKILAVATFLVVIAVAVKVFFYMNSY